MALGEGRRPEDQRSSDYKQKLSCTEPLFVLSFLYEVIPPRDVTLLYEKPACQGALPRSATPLPCFETAQQLKRLRREWHSSLPRSTTLSILTRIKLDSSSGCVQNGKVARPAAHVPSRPMGIRPQNAARGFRAGEPTQSTQPLELLSGLETGQGRCRSW